MNGWVRWHRASRLLHGKDPSWVIKYTRSALQAPGPSRRHYSERGIGDEMRQNKVFKSFSVSSRCCANHKYDTTPGRLNVHTCIRGRACRRGGFPPGKEGVRFTVCPLSACWWWTVRHLRFTLVLFADGSWKQRTKSQGGMVRRPVLSSIIMAGGVAFLSELISRTRCSITL